MWESHSTVRCPTIADNPIRVTTLHFLSLILVTATKKSTEKYYMWFIVIQIIQIDRRKSLLIPVISVMYVMLDIVR